MSTTNTTTRHFYGDTISYRAATELHANGTNYVGVIKCSDHSTFRTHTHYETEDTALRVARALLDQISLHAAVVLAQLEPDLAD